MADELHMEIGAREIYDLLTQVTGKVDRLVDQTENVQRAQADHETRIRALERARWPLPSLSALIALASLLLGLYLASRRP